jgi:hypothetical protein
MKDVRINQDQFNIGQQMLSLGIVLFEIPSNMILYRVGPGKWLTLQLFFFGAVSTFQAFQRSYGSFIATRFLLGVSESGGCCTDATSPHDSTDRSSRAAYSLQVSSPVVFGPYPPGTPEMRPPNESCSSTLATNSGKLLPSCSPMVSYI